MDDLRAEVCEEWGIERVDAIDAYIRAFERGEWADLDLDAADLALCAFAEKLTRTPGAMTEADVEGLRSEGLDDTAIHDAIQVIAYFNYINRVADAIDVELEPEYPPHPRRG